MAHLSKLEVTRGELMVPRGALTVQHSKRGALGRKLTNYMSQDKESNSVIA